MKKKQVKRAFTLVEILVVIGIICIITAITFPVVARAKESARQTSCASNLRQVYSALQLYGVDHDQLATNPRSMMNIAAYAKSREVFRCPADHHDRVCPDGLYDPDGFAVGQLQEIERSPFQVSYASLFYIGDWRFADRFWTNALNLRYVGVFACVYHARLAGKERYAAWHQGMAPREGYSHRVLSDGSLFTYQIKFPNPNGANPPVQALFHPHHSIADPQQP